jgi:inward rectifier potassium channel
MAYKPNEPQKEPPRFTRYIGTQPGRRLAIVRGQDSGRWTDIYHQVLTVPWSVFLIGLAALFIGLNAIFALLYMVDPHALTNVPADDFRDAFIFSVATFGVQTITGASHVSMSANDGYAAIIVMVEAFTGILYLGMVTAIMFARFSRPFARILFSNVAIIADFDGVPTMMFRAANQRGNRILDAAISVSLAHEATSKEGLVMRRFDELTLMRSRSPLFALSWTIMHRIDENSPLRGLDFKTMCEQEFEILILLSGTDETLADIIYARHSYVPADFRWNHRFVDVLSIAPSGHRIVDLTRFHDTEPLEAAVPLQV